MRWLFAGLALIVAATVPVGAIRPAGPHQPDALRGTVRIVLVSDVMVGRAVAPVLERDPVPSLPESATSSPAPTSPPPIWNRG